jgi:tellurite resistance protein
VVWLVVTIAYLWNVRSTGRAGTELLDATFAPFTALLFILPMILGVAWSATDETSGRTVFFVGLVLTMLLGGWMTGQWIISDLRLVQWHPGYFLPTVAGGFIASTGCATLGHDSLARAMFGYGAICWFALGSIILARLLVETSLPPGLTPTIAIEVAPPVVAGSAWLEINGHHIDTMILFLAGYALLMVVTQVRLFPVYARLPFAPGWWAFSFSYAAAVAFSIRLLALGHPVHERLLVLCLLCLVTVAVAALVARTVAGLLAGTFLPRATAPAVAPTAQPSPTS